MTTPTLTLPDALRRVLPAARWEAVTEGQSVARVYRATRHVVKVAPTGRAGHDLFGEKERLRWLAGRVPVPEVLAYEVEAGLAYLAMTRVPGMPMSHPDALLHPLRNAELLARALRQLHALPVRDCPFNMSLPVTLRLALERVQSGQVNEQDTDPQRSGQSAAEVFGDLVRARPSREDVVVTHGNPTLPNVLVEGEFVSGLIGVGRAGLADRHADLALAHRDLRSRYGEDAAHLFLQTYGPHLVDTGKLAYYRALDGLF